jgi:ATP-dependent DNA ligase
MKCHDSIEHIKYPAIAQVKYDGGRCIVHCIDESSGEYIAYTSSGRSVDLGESFKGFVKIYMKTDEMFDGEIVAYKDGEHLDRKTSNGLFNKAGSGKIKPDELETLRFIAWDIIDETGLIPYKDRFSTLVSRFTGHNKDDFESLVKESEFLWFYSRMDTAQSAVVNNEEEAVLFYTTQLNKGLEGAIIKNFDGVWKPKRVKHQGKMKNELECELRVVGWEPHIKDKNKLGSFLFSCHDSDMIFNVGSGINDDMRSQDPETFIGKIATVRFNSLTSNKKEPDKFTLYIPRVIEFRSDKIEADTIERIKNL